MEQKKKIYERDFRIPLVIAVLLLLVLTAVYFGQFGEEEPTDQTEGAETTMEPTETQTGGDPKMPKAEFKTDLSAYEKYMQPSASEIEKNGYGKLVNKQNEVGEGFKPNDLVSVRDARKSIELRECAAKALEAMFNEIQAAGFRRVYVTSAYRSYSYQVSLFNYYIGDEMGKDSSLTREEATKKVLRYSAAPGTSEHQTGLCVDLMTDPMTELDESFENYEIFDWLTENAWKFGFVLRYPKDKVSITGYDYEPWHYRFVGREAAWEMWSKGLCLEEYVG